MISMIWAMDEDNLIGNGDKIPWHIKEDLIYYKEKTKGQHVLMGEATYFSLKKYYQDKPLPYGKIYVATAFKELKIDGVEMVYDIKDFLNNYHHHRELFVVGGATIYTLSLPYAERLYISFINGHHEGDKYFPEIDFSKFNLTWYDRTDLVRYTIWDKKKNS